jgi:hypothetical protein
LKKIIKKKKLLNRLSARGVWFSCEPHGNTPPEPFSKGCHVHEGIKSLSSFFFREESAQKVVVRNVDVSTLFRIHWNPILERMNAVQRTERKEQKKKKEKKKKKEEEEGKSLLEPSFGPGI